MIPADLASRLRLVAQDIPAPVQAPASARQVTDVLSELSAGQRIMAEIQTLLPNGMYRAVVGQRELTLALPFAAKPGDTLELEVVENDGKLTLAAVANRGAAGTETQKGESVPTTLSKAGNLIGNLLGEVDQQGGRAKPAALNANQPLVDTFPAKAADLAPILKESLAKSGMFYEAHQARWVEGRLPTASLLQEPQGKLSTPSALLNPQRAALPEIYDPRLGGYSRAPLSPQESLIAASASSGLNGLDPSAQSSLPPGQTEAPPGGPGANNIDQEALNSGLPDKGSGLSNQSMAHDDVSSRVNQFSAQQMAANPDNPAGQRLGPAVHPELTPIVQQQLNALATQNYVWQGQVWPGQTMHWEINEDEHRAPTSPDEPSGRWQTRLKLDLPQLGGIDATLRLGASGKLELSLIADNEQSRNTLQMAGANLGQSLQAAGLQLSSFAVSHGEIAS